MHIELHRIYSSLWLKLIQCNYWQLKDDLLSQQAEVLAVCRSVAFGCVLTTTQRKKYISREIKKAVVTPHHSEMDYMALFQISLSFYSVKAYSHCRKHSRAFAVFPGVDVPANSTQSQTAMLKKMF